MIKPKYSCHYCNKEYTRKMYYDRHLVCCQMIHMSKREKQLDIQENYDTPSTRDLYLIIQELSSKCIRFEKKIKELENTIYSNSTNIQPLNVLNSHEELEKVDNNIVYDEWINSLIVTEEHLQTVFERNIIEAYKDIILNKSIKTKEVFCSSRIKQNEIYVLTYKNKVKEWVKYTREDINQIEYCLTKKLMEKFREWEAKNRERLFSDTYSMNYQNNLNKIMGGKLSRDMIKKNFYDILFNINKVNFN